jgi:hypothetical protein
MGEDNEKKHVNVVRLHSKFKLPVALLTWWDIILAESALLGVVKLYALFKLLQTPLYAARNGF